MLRLLPRLVLLLIASPVSAVTIAWTPVGNPGNPADQGGFDGAVGSVAYDYQIGTYEVTNAQYVEFLNAKAASDPYGLYNTQMGSGFGGITRSGVDGSYSYSVRRDRGDMPVNYESFYDALRFVNWLNNGQGNGDTETGAYTLLGGTAVPSNGTTVARNAGATIVLPTEDEWHKAAYYSPGGVYYDYPAGSNAQTICAAPTSTPNRANCQNAVGDFTIVGSYSGSASPYGTFDQGGNAEEWTETNILGNRVVRGGYFSFPFPLESASASKSEGPTDENSTYHGFRVAMIPEPDTGLLVIAGLVGLARSRSGRR